MALSESPAPQGRQELRIFAMQASAASSIDALIQGWQLHDCSNLDIALPNKQSLLRYKCCDKDETHDHLPES